MKKMKTVVKTRRGGRSPQDPQNPRMRAVARSRTTIVMRTRGVFCCRLSVGQVKNANHTKNIATSSRHRAPIGPGAISPAMNRTPNRRGACHRGRWCNHTRGTALRRSTDRRRRLAPGVWGQSPPGKGCPGRPGRSSSCSGENMSFVSSGVGAAPRGACDTCGCDPRCAAWALARVFSRPPCDLTRWVDHEEPWKDRIK